MADPFAVDGATLARGLFLILRIIAVHSSIFAPRRRDDYFARSPKFPAFTIL
jgi:hypothetical protein